MTHILYRETTRPILPFSQREAMNDLSNDDLIKYGVLKRQQFCTFYTVRAWLPPLGFFISKWYDVEVDMFSDGPVWMGFVPRGTMHWQLFRSDLCGTDEGWEAMAAPFATTSRKPVSLHQAIREFFDAKPHGLTDLSGHQRLRFEETLRTAVDTGLLPHPAFRSRRTSSNHKLRTLPPPRGLATDMGEGVCPKDFLP